MIQEFHDKTTLALFHGVTPKGVPSDLVRRAVKKLKQLNAATTPDYLRVPPGNHLEALDDDRAGQHSIRVNKQWRICFIWKDGHAYRVEFCDYH
jgi:proteic killer suppression protein